MSTRFQLASNLNNNGVDALIWGRDHEAAIQYLTKSLLLMKTELLGPAPVSKNNISSRPSSGTMELQQGKVFQQRFGQEENAVPRSEIRGAAPPEPCSPTTGSSMLIWGMVSPSFCLTPSSCHHDLFFNQAIRVPIGGWMTNPEAPGFLGLQICTSAAVVFNLALTHHFLVATTSTGTIHSIPDGCSSSPITKVAMISKAEKLYRTALCLLDENKQVCSTLRIAYIMKLACLYNLARLYFLRGEYENARELLICPITELLRPSLLVEGGGGSGCVLGGETLVEELTMNLILLFKSTSQMAAAAA